ncbi:MAG TPA: Hpt domain-containing protein [Puia sp.]|jgi:HPt (histidine-containing phosphotransfer) domain-containing protein|nr:Hpt domain-containing protein [Puia sp.]
MNSGANHTPFTFSPPFNSQYINELYDNDTALINETFADVVKEYSPMLQQVILCYRAGDIPALKSAVHRIKPLLGYVGLTTLQSECQQFESNCERDVFPSLHDDFAALSAHLSSARVLIEEEKARLEAFLNA